MQFLAILPRITRNTRAQFGSYFLMSVDWGYQLIDSYSRNSSPWGCLFYLLKAIDLKGEIIGKILARI